MCSITSDRIACLARQGADIEAELREALEEDEPNDPMGPLRKARALLKKRRDEGALAFLEKLAQPAEWCLIESEMPLAAADELLTKWIRSKPISRRLND